MLAAGLVQGGMSWWPDLYASDGIYGRWNGKAIVSLIAGVGAALMRGTPVVDLDGVPEA